MSVRDPGHQPPRARRGGTHPREGAYPIGPRPFGRRWLLPALVTTALALVVAIGCGSGLLAGAGGGPSPAGPSQAALAAPGATLATAEPNAPSGSADAPAESPAASGVPGAGSPGGAPSTVPGTPPASEPADVAIVPVISFRSTRSSVRAADVRSIAEGSGPLAGLVLVERDADPILAALGLDRVALGKRLTTVRDAPALDADLARHRTRLGFLRADEIDASVRALAWGGRSLFGVDRVAKLAAWPLTARLPVRAAGRRYDPATAWTLVAGGDILLDRGVSLAIEANRDGADFPFDGGTATITGRCKDCSPMGWDLPYAKRTGNAGAVRDLVHGADLAIANFENPAPNHYRFHAHGTVFSANPAYIAGLARVGLDWVSLANNHIGDAGRNGILQTIANLDEHGIRHSGAGRNTAAAHRAALVNVGGVTVGLLGYDTIAAYYQAGSSTPGSARMTGASLKADISAARAAGADVVVVFPHWGVEYQASPTARQQRLAHAAINAGADLVIGNHPHWAGAMEVYKGRPIWYALGNFVFDQTWSEPTMEGLTLELTFQGRNLVQARMRPHLILGRAQPNFLDPAGAGRVVMSQVFNASGSRLPW